MLKKKLFAIAFLFTLILSAQEQKKELQVHTINGKEFYIHVVDSGNTLYAISRLYAIPIDDLKKENPRLTEALTIGDRLLIPLKAIKRKDLKESPNIDGNFLIYEVQKNNTLYSISKEYHVEISDLVAVNPEIEEGFKKGMKIKIPINKIKDDTEQKAYISPAEASPFMTHKVLPKETLYALSKLYNTTVDSILEVNNGLPGGLKEGELINIPILRTFKDTTLTVIEFDSAAIKPSYSVALLLPFYLNLFEKANDTTYRQGEELTEQLYDKAQYAIEFYQGFKIALDSLVEQGLNIKLYTFDTQNDSAVVSKILKDTILKKVDLIVGPMYLQSFMMVADFAKLHEINIVSPVRLSNKILLGNNYVSKVITSEPILNRFLGRYAFDSLRNDHLILAYPDHVEERKRAESIKSEYYDLLSKSSDTAQNNAIKELLLKREKISEIQAKLVPNRLNTIVVPTTNQAFMTQLLTTLYMLEDFEIKVVGLAEWENFDNIEVEYLNKLDVHLVVSEFIDREAISIKKFEKTYYEQTNSLPTNFAFLGFDVAYYYLGLLKDFGTNFEMMFLGVQNEQLSRKFEFFKTGIESGYENHSSFVIRYHDSQLQRIY